MTQKDYDGVIDFLYSLNDKVGNQFDWAYLESVQIIGRVNIYGHWSSEMVVTSKDQGDTTNTLTLGPSDVQVILSDFLEKDIGLKIEKCTKMLNTGTEIIETIILTPYAGPDAGFYSERLYEKTLTFMIGRKYDLAHPEIISWRMQMVGGLCQIFLEIKPLVGKAVGVQTMDLPIFTKMTEGMDALSQALTTMGVEWEAKKILTSVIFPPFSGAGPNVRTTRISNIIIRRI